MKTWSMGWPGAAMMVRPSAMVRLVAGAVEW
jgi:hypothetical protein